MIQNVCWKRHAVHLETNSMTCKIHTTPAKASPVLRQSAVIQTDTATAKTSHEAVPQTRHTRQHDTGHRHTNCSNTRTVAKWAHGIHTTRNPSPHSNWNTSHSQPSSSFTPPGKNHHTPLSWLIASLHHLLSFAHRSKRNGKKSPPTRNPAPTNSAA
jgi:hypothetical protein